MKIAEIAIRRPVFGVMALLVPIVFGLMSTFMIGVGMLASYMPARRASSVDPLVSLSSE